LSRVVFTTVRHEREVWELYTKSKLFVSPSLYEGFGMPTIEALALGLPVAVSDIPVFHEVAGDLATYFDPRDPSDIAAKLGPMLADPKPPDPELVRRVLAPYFWSAIYGAFVDDLFRTAGRQRSSPMAGLERPSKITSAAEIAQDTTAIP
jgi:glycosyltransferase involved in cell wall biosynthesis